jgi:hypothetical protein
VNHLSAKARGTYPENGEENIDEEVGTATALEKDSEGREKDGKDNLANVTIE